LKFKVTLFKFQIPLYYAHTFPKAVHNNDLKEEDMIVKITRQNVQSPHLMTIQMSASETKGQYWIITECSTTNLDQSCIPTIHFPYFYLWLIMLNWINHLT
jgi:hypothetical protein